MSNQDELVVVRLTDSQRRALAYAAQWGLDYGKWPSEAYRDTAKSARNALIAAASLPPTENDAHG